jgi:chromosome segregation ATPase
LLKEKQSVEDVEAWISELLQEGKKIVRESDHWKPELTLTQQKLTEMEWRTPQCNHGDLEEIVTNLESQLTASAPEQAYLAGELEDTQAQLEIMRQSANEYQEQVNRILRITEGSTDRGGHQEEREERGNMIPRFSGEDRKELGDGKFIWLRRWLENLKLSTLNGRN